MNRSYDDMMIFLSQTDETPEITIDNKRISLKYTYNI